VPVIRIATLLVLGTGILGTHAAAALPVSASLLRPRARDLPGFAGAKASRYMTTSAIEWARAYNQTEAAIQQEAAELIQRGFQEAVSVFFTGRREGPHSHREAISVAIVFTTPAGAEQELAKSVADDLRAFRTPTLRQYRVPAIPGATGLGSVFYGKHHGASGNVLFSTGRCFFVVGDALHGDDGRAQGEHPSTVAAITLYKRTKAVCAG
jgi:hypothetical protein